MWRTRPTPLLLLVLAQAAFILIGEFFLGFAVSWFEVALTIATAHATDFLLASAANLRSGKRPVFFFSQSTLAAALGICLFFRALSPWYFVLAAFLAIASKYLIVVRGKHIFNPSNFAIVVSVFAFSSATTIEFTQWGTNTWLHLFMAAVCFAIAWYAGAMATTLSFLSVYTLLLMLTTAYLPQLFTLHHYGLIGPSLALFASFMITDPKTSPQDFRGRLLHGSGIAALYFALEIVGVRYPLFAASFAITLLSLISRESLGSISRMYPALATLPRNSLAWAFSMVLCAVALAVLVLPREPKLYAWPITPRFILEGIDSEAASCRGTPVLQPQQSIVTTSGKTEGAAWGDYNGDGWDDLFVSNSTSESKLYRNDQGTLTEATKAAGLPSFLNSSAYFIDYDNDGDLDLAAFPHPDPSADKTPLVRFFRNDRGTFTEVSELLGFPAREPTRVYSTGSFADYDNDGDLDFTFAAYGETLLVNTRESKPLIKSFFDPRYQQAGWYICDPKEVEKLMGRLGKFIRPQDAAFMQRFAENRGCVLARYTINRLAWVSDPTELPDESRLLNATLVIPGELRLFEWRAGRFVESAAFAESTKSAFSLPKAQQVTVGIPVSYISGLFLQPLSFDYDLDGKVDLFLSIDTAANRLLHNEGGFRFRDVTEEANMDFAGTGMGTDVADVNRDGLPDLFVDNTREDYLYMHEGSTFTRADQSSMGMQNIGWGTSFFDYNLDGWDDLIVANGDVQETFGQPLTDIARPYFRTDNLYRNDRGVLEEVTGRDMCPDRASGRALAVSDYDNNGTPDVFIGNYFAENVLLKNTTSQKHYLKVTLEGERSNRMGIGALVRVTAQGGVQTKQIFGGNSFFSQNSQALLFGLGDSTDPVDIVVNWPSGAKTTLRGVRPDQTLHIKE